MIDPFTLVVNVSRIPLTEMNDLIDYFFKNLKNKTVLEVLPENYINMVDVASTKISLHSLLDNKWAILILQTFKSSQYTLMAML